MTNSVITICLLPRMPNLGAVLKLRTNISVISIRHNCSDITLEKLPVHVANIPSCKSENWKFSEITDYDTKG